MQSLCEQFSTLKGRQWAQGHSYSLSWKPVPTSVVDCLLLREKEGSAPRGEHLKHPQSTASQGRSLSTLRWENTRHLGTVRDTKIQTRVPLVSFSHSAMGQQSGSPPYRGGFFPKNTIRISFIAACAQICIGKTVVLYLQRCSFSWKLLLTEKKWRLRWSFFEDLVTKAFSDCFCQEMLPCELERLQQAYILSTIYNSSIFQ